MVGATLPLWIPASARMTNSVAGDNYFRTNDEVGGRIDAAGRGDRDLLARREPSSCRADRYSIIPSLDSEACVVAAKR